jgi:hypothetical protein
VRCRGTPPADLGAIADCAMRLGALVPGEPRIAEIEINPVRFFLQKAQLRSMC